MVNGSLYWSFSSGPECLYQLDWSCLTWLHQMSWFQTFLSTKARPTSESVIQLSRAVLHVPHLYFDRSFATIYFLDALQQEVWWWTDKITSWGRRLKEERKEALDMLVRESLWISNTSVFQHNCTKQRLEFLSKIPLLNLLSFYKLINSIIEVSLIII